MKSVYVTVRNISDYYLAIDMLADGSIPFNDISGNGNYCLECATQDVQKIKLILDCAGFDYQLRQ